MSALSLIPIRADVGFEDIWVRTTPDRATNHMHFLKGALPGRHCRTRTQSIEIRSTACRTTFMFGCTTVEPRPRAVRELHLYWAKLLRSLLAYAMGGLSGEQLRSHKALWRGDHETRKKRATATPGERTLTCKRFSTQEPCSRFSEDQLLA